MECAPAEEGVLECKRCGAQEVVRRARDGQPDAVDAYLEHENRKLMCEIMNITFQYHDGVMGARVAVALIKEVLDVSSSSEEGGSARYRKRMRAGAEHTDDGPRGSGTVPMRESQEFIAVKSEDPDDEPAAQVRGLRSN